MKLLATDVVVKCRAHFEKTPPYESKNASIVQW